MESSTIIIWSVVIIVILVTAGIVAAYYRGQKTRDKANTAWDDMMKAVTAKFVFLQSSQKMFTALPSHDVDTTVERVCNAYAKGYQNHSIDDITVGEKLFFETLVPQLVLWMKEHADDVTGTTMERFVSTLGERHNNMSKELKKYNETIYAVNGSFEHFPLSVFANKFMDENMFGTMKYKESLQHSDFDILLETAKDT